MGVACLNLQSAIILSAVLLGGSHGPPSNGRLHGRDCNSIDDVLMLSEDDVDVCTAGLLIAKEYDHDLDVAAARSRVDAMAAEVVSGVSGEAPVDVVASELTRYLFTRLGYVTGAEWMPQRVLVAKAGNCVGLTWLYLSIAERIGLPLYAVRAPNHVLIRYDLPDGHHVNVETTDAGRHVMDDALVTSFKIDAPSLDRGIYLTKLRKRQFIAIMLNNLGQDLDNLPSREQTLMKAITLDPRYAEAYVSLSRLRLDGGKIDEAMQYADTATDTADCLHSAYVLRGKIYQLKKDTDKAQKAYRRAISLCPRDHLPYRELGSIYLEERKIPDAVSVLKEALIREPNDACVHSLLGQCYGQAKEYPKALSHFQEAIKNDPNTRDIYAMIGLAHIRLGDKEKGLSYVRKQLDIDPNNAKANSLLGITMAMAQDYDSAILYLNKAVQVDHANADAWYNLALAYYRNKEMQKVVESLQQAISADEHSIDARMMFARCYQELGDREACRRALGAIETEIQENLPLRYAVASLYYEIHDYDAAIRHCRTITEANAKHIQAHWMLARAFFHKEMYTEAAEQVRRVQSLGQPVPEEFLRVLKNAGVDPNGLQ